MPLDVTSPPLPTALYSACLCCLDYLPVGISVFRSCCRAQQLKVCSLKLDRPGFESRLCYLLAM